MRGIEKVELIDKGRRKLWTLPGGMKTATEVGFTENEKEVEECAAWLDRTLGDELGPILKRYCRKMNMNMKEMLQDEFVNLVSWLKMTVKIAVRKALLKHRVSLMLHQCKHVGYYLTAKRVRNGAVIGDLRFKIKKEKDLKTVWGLLVSFHAKVLTAHQLDDEAKDPFTAFRRWMERLAQVELNEKGWRLVETESGLCRVKWSSREEWLHDRK